MAKSKAHEDLQPRFECLEEKDNAAFIIKVHFSPAAGFVRKEQLKVQLVGKPTPHKLCIGGERKSGSDKKWDWFKEEFPVAADCDTDAITAKLENGILWVTLPRKATSAQEKAQEQTNTFQARAKVAPPEPKPLQPQNPTDGYGKEAREEASSEAVRGSQSSDPPPRPQEPHKKAEKRESSEPAVPQEVLKHEESKSHTPQAKATELKDEKSDTGRSSDEAKRSSVTEEGKSSENTAKGEGYDGTCLEMNLRRRGKTLNLALVVLAAIGIGLYVKNIYDYKI